MVYSSSQGKWRGSVDLSPLVTVRESKVMTCSCNRRGSDWISEKGSSLKRCLGTATGSLGQWSWSQAAKVQKSHMVWLLGDHVWSQELGSMILMGLFRTGLFYNNLYNLYNVYNFCIYPIIVWYYLLKFMQSLAYFKWHFS